MVAFALSCVTLIPPISSMWIGEVSNKSSVLRSTFLCASSIVFILSHFKGSCELIDSNLSTNCSELISRLKTAVGTLSKQASWYILESIKAVLPIPGLAATITRSGLTHPHRVLFSSSNPVLNPSKPPFCAISRE